tara:strand:- start:623 stop:985 length:363 start_codon:yes stop_codon:yes gene_type:complete
MTMLRFALWISTFVIFAVTFGAIADSGYNWPGVFLGDLAAVNWRSQFNTDLVIHLGLVGVWVAWREGGGLKGCVYGVFCVVWGGMFTFPYLLVAIARTRGDYARLFLGVRANANLTGAQS